MPSLITLITDFGTADPYAGVLKGVILSINPSCTIVDITHQIPPQDINEAAFTLMTAYAYFPPGTIHLVIVDPGVGGTRRPLLIETENYFFVGPDNGVFSGILHKPGVTSVIELTNADYFLREVSTTFHGRDIFAPVAAHLSQGVPCAKFGRPISDVMLLDWPQPRLIRPGEAQGRILHIDHFGNLITNVSREFITQALGNRPFTIECAKAVIQQIVPAYSYAKPGELCGVFGSSNYLEISVANGSARERLNAHCGDVVRIIETRREKNIE